MKKQAIIAAAIVIAAFGLFVEFKFLKKSDPYFGQYHDDAVYVASAKSLARGDGYRQPFLPNNAFQTKYPPVYPVVLSTIWRIDNRYPQNVAWMKGVETLLGFMFVGLSVAYLLWSRRVSAGLALVVFAATLLNSRFLAFIPITMSDLLYAVLSVGALWLADLAGSGDARRHPPQSESKAASGAYRFFVAAGLLAGLATLTRSAGTALVAACFFALVARKPKWAVVFACVAAVLVIPWMIWAQLHQDVSTPSMIWYTSYSAWMQQSYRDVGAAFIGAKIADLFRGLMVMVWPLLSSQSYGRLVDWQFFLIYRLLFWALWVVLIIGLLNELRNPQRRALPLYLVLYLGTSIVWPGFFEWRMFIVILPFLYYFFFRGFRVIGKRFRQPKLNQALAIAFGAYLVLGSAISAWQHAGRYPPLAPSLELTAKDQHRELLDAYKWIELNTPRNAVFVCINDPLLYLYTGRKAMQPTAYEGWRTIAGKLITPESVMEAVRESQAGYIMIDPSIQAGYASYAQFGQSVLEIAKKQPELLQPVYVSPHQLVTICRLHR